MLGVTNKATQDERSTNLEVQSYRREEIEDLRSELDSHTVYIFAIVPVPYIMVRAGPRRVCPSFQ